MYFIWFYMRYIRLIENFDFIFQRHEERELWGRFTRGLTFLEALSETNWDVKELAINGMDLFVAAELDQGLGPLREVAASQFENRWVRRFWIIQSPIDGRAPPTTYITTTPVAHPER